MKYNLFCILVSYLYGENIKIANQTVNTYIYTYLQLFCILISYSYGGNIKIANQTVNVYAYKHLQKY